MVPTPTQDRTIATSLLKAISLVTCLGERGGGLTTADLVRALGYPRTTVVRILSTFMLVGWVKSINGRWHLGDSLREIGGDHPYSSLKARFHHVLEALRDETHESVVLGVLAGDGVIHVEHVQGPRPVNVVSQVGERFPLHQLAMGKLWMALKPELESHGLSVVNEETRRNAVKEEVEEARRTQIAWNHEETAEGVEAFALPLFDRGELAATVAVCWPAGRLPKEKEREVAQRSQVLVNRLGFGPTGSGTPAAGRGAQIPSMPHSSAS